ncbi:MAG: hypothetical protein R2788_20425 [Saprospiraceae bacterium]
MATNSRSDVNRFCAIRPRSVNQAAAYVKSGFSELIIAGGVESMSRVKNGPDGGALMMDPAVALPHNIVPQGISADLIASKFGYSRNDVDEFALRSQMNAAAAEQDNRFASRMLIVDINGITILATDENIRPSTTFAGPVGPEPCF